jgi:hypothetical protein
MASTPATGSERDTRASARTGGTAPRKPRVPCEPSAPFRDRSSPTSAPSWRIPGGIAGSWTVTPHFPQVDVHSHRNGVGQCHEYPICRDSLSTSRSGPDRLRPPLTAPNRPRSPPGRPALRRGSMAYRSGSSRTDGTSTHPPPLTTAPLVPCASLYPWPQLDAAAGRPTSGRKQPQLHQSHQHRPRLVWLPRSCCQSCMHEASTSFDWAMRGGGSSPLAASAL